MKLVVGCPVKDRGWILPAWFEALSHQDADFEVVCLYSPSDDNTLAVLQEHGATLVADDQPGRSLQEIDGHMWGAPHTYGYIAGLRNRLLAEVLDLGADYFFSLDSDILIPEHGLDHLLAFAQEHPGMCAPAANMASNGLAWNMMQWTGPGFAGRLAGEPRMGAQRADIIMGAVLMDREAMACQWHEHPQGEDIGLCLRAEQLGVERWWVPEVRCDHVMKRQYWPGG